jgi:hypothetical protein
MTAPRADPAEIARTIALLSRPGDVREVRIPKTPHQGTISGYFGDTGLLVKSVAGLNGGYPGVYITLNPVADALLARAENRLKPRAQVTTSDKDVLRRHWIPIDSDAVRPADVSSSNEEHELALERCCEIRFELAEEGWSPPIRGDSGNGGHLLYPIDLPNDEAATTLLAGVLKALSARFSDKRVKVDESVFNAARIWKLYGTVARKGDDTRERPHRLSRILEVPPTLTPVPRELLEELAVKVKAAAPPPSHTGRPGGDMEGFLARKGARRRI